MESFGLDIIDMKVIKLIHQDADVNYFNLIIEKFGKNQIGRRNILALKDETIMSVQSYPLLQRHGAN